MKIAVTATGRDLASKIDPLFGRAAYFIIVDSETLDFELIENSQSFNLPQGAGIHAGQTIAGKKVDVLITGNCGPKAFRVLTGAGIKIVVGATGTVRDIILQYKKGELKPADRPNVDGHWV